MYHFRWHYTSEREDKEGFIDVAIPTWSRGWDRYDEVYRDAEAKAHDDAVGLLGHGEFRLWMIHNDVSEVSDHYGLNGEDHWNKKRSVTEPSLWTSRR